MEIKSYSEELVRAEMRVRRATLRYGHRLSHDEAASEDEPSSQAQSIQSSSPPRMITHAYSPLSESNRDGALPNLGKP